MADHVNHSPRSRPDASVGAPPARRVVSLAAWTAVVLLAALSLTVFVEPVSRDPSMLTVPAHSLPVVAVAAAVWLMVGYPIWPGVLLGEGDPLEGFWRWLVLRLVEVGIVLAVALPVLLAAAVFSGAPLARAGELLAGLSGTAAVAVAYRLVHQCCGVRFRALALLDALALVFVPLLVGYLLLEFYEISMGWCWLISPAGLAHGIAFNGLSAAAILVGVVGYVAVAVVAVLLVRPMGRWYRDEQAQHARRLGQRSRPSHSPFPDV